MATTPAFANTVNNNAGLTNATADTSTTAPTNITTIFTAGANGSKVNFIRITQVQPSTSAGVLNIFLYDGSTYHLHDNYAYPINTAPTTTTVVPPVDLYYDNLVIKTGWTVRVANTVQCSSGPTAAAFKLLAFGADF